MVWADRSSEVRSSYVYHNYLDLSTGTSQTVDIVFSDAITKFHAVDGSSSEVIPVYTGDSNIPDGPINDAKQNNRKRGPHLYGPFFLSFFLFFI